MENRTQARDKSAVSRQITLGVFRRLDNRSENLLDDSPRALELHNRRKAALHEVFDTQKSVEILNWGGTDDPKTHELVEIVVGAIAMPAFQYAVVPGLKFLGQKLAEKAVNGAASELVKAVVSWLRPKQESKEILDLVITLPDKTVISVDPPDRYATISITFADNKVESVTYAKSPLAATG
jgi:hypothetical protein